jgi:hypothetical protein
MVIRGMGGGAGSILGLSYIRGDGGGRVGSHFELDLWIDDYDDEEGLRRWIVRWHGVALDYIALHQLFIAWSSGYGALLSELERTPFNQEASWH